MVPAGNPCAEFESWSGLIAGSTIPHPDTVWRWVPGDRMHTRTFMHARLHTQPVSVACLLCLLLCFLVLLPLLLSFCLSCLQILWLMDMIILFFLLTHISIVDSCFPHVKSHYILQKEKTVLYYIMHGLYYFVHPEHANISIKLPIKST